MHGKKNRHYDKKINILISDYKVKVFYFLLNNVHTLIVLNNAGNAFRCKWG